MRAISASTIVQESVLRQDALPVVLALLKHDIDCFGRLQQQWIINLRILHLNIDAMIKRLEAAAITAETRTEWAFGAGSFARICDPKGNPIELWEPAAATD